MPASCNSSTAGREGKEPPETGILHTSVAVSKAMGCGSISPAGWGYRPFQDIHPFLVLHSYLKGRLSGPCLHHCCHCPDTSFPLLHALGDWAQQKEPSEMVFFASEQTFPPLASSSWASQGWRVQPSPPTASLSLHGQEKAKQPEAETSFRHNQVKNTYFSDQSSAPKWSENPGKMRQAQLVAGFQHQHLPSEESSKESRLIHPGHTSISSSYY